MKQLIIPTALLLLAALILTACEGPMGPMGPMGPPGRDGLNGQDGFVNIDTRYYTISHWNLSNDHTYYYASVTNPAVTTDVLYYGVVNGYLVKDFETPQEYHIPLPFDIYHNEVIEGTLLSWTETVSFDVSTGTTIFYFEPSDFFTGDLPPTYTFKIVTMW